MTDLSGSGKVDRRATSARRDTAGYPCAALVFLAAFVYRFLSLSLTDDDFHFFAYGRQIAEFGALAFADLAQEGRPLHYLVSAWLQALFGYRLIGEVMLDLVMLSAAAVLVFVLATGITGTRLVAAVITTAAVLMAPRLYDYPKAIIPLIALWLCGRYLALPRPSRAIALGLFTAGAFLYRYDLGAYVGAAATATFVVAAFRATELRWAPAAAYAAVLGAVLLPYGIVLQSNGGLVAHVETTRRFVQREVTRSVDAPPRFRFDLSRPLVERNVAWPVNVRWADGLTEEERSELEQQYSLTAGRRREGRTWRYELADLRVENQRAMLTDPRVEDTANLNRADITLDPASLADYVRRWLRAPAATGVAPGVLTRDNAVAWLYFLLVGLPYAAAVVLALRRFRGAGLPDRSADVIPALVLVAAAAPLLLRDNLYQNTRLADLAFPAAIVGAWFFRTAWHCTVPSRLWVARGIAVLMLGITVASAGAFGSFKRRLDDVVVLLDPAGLVTFVDARLRDLAASPPPLEWLSKETGIRGAAAYLRHCTATGDQVLVYGYHPDVVYFSGRAAAGDRIVLLRGFWNTPDEQRRTIAAIATVPTPIVLTEARAIDGDGRTQPVDAGFALINQYLVDDYDLAGTTGFGASTDTLFHVWVDRQRTPDRTYEPFGLPCFEDDATGDRLAGVQPPRRGRG